MACLRVLRCLFLSALVFKERIIGDDIWEVLMLVKYLHHVGRMNASCFMYLYVYICIRTHTHHVFHLVLEGQCPVCEGCDTILEVHSRFRLIKSRPMSSFHLLFATVFFHAKTMLETTALHVGYPSFLFPSHLCVSTLWSWILARNLFISTSYHAFDIVRFLPSQSTISTSQKN